MSVERQESGLHASHDRPFRGARMMRPIGLAPPICQNPQVQYFGGPVIQNVLIYAVYWGPNIDTTVTQNLPRFYADLTQSPFMDLLTEYDTVGLNGAMDNMPGSNQGIGRGSFGGAFTIMPSTTPANLDDSVIGQELLAQIAAGHLPQPSMGCDGQTRTLYMIEFPRGVSITDPARHQSCSNGGFCAYHSTTALPNGTPVPYGVTPFMGSGSGCAQGCGSMVYLDRLTSSHAHEIAEAITDTDTGLAQNLDRPLGWYDTQCGEIGDMCGADDTLTSTAGTTWTVQTIWSNRNGQCISASPVPLPPVCTSPGNPAGCRTCTCADASGACAPMCGMAGQACCVNNMCNAPSTCGGGGTPNVCGCAPKTCLSAHASCGTVPDGCGGMLMCGSCTAPQTCGGGGMPNVCGCMPRTCAAAHANCGMVSDGCGGMLDCGTCNSPQTCGGGGVANMCGCHPTTCSAAHATCGQVPDNCGAMLECGNCSGSDMCIQNQCVTPVPDAGFYPDAEPPPAPDATEAAPDASSRNPGQDGSGPNMGPTGPGPGGTAPDSGLFPDLRLNTANSGGCGCNQTEKPSSPLWIAFAILPLLAARRRR